MIRDRFPAITNLKMAVATGPADLARFQEIFQEAVNEGIKGDNPVRPLQCRGPPALADTLTEFPGG